jgi:sugar O-acyltransferase (sialic acid O-acetyltransferase NeuD family)
MINIYGKGGHAKMIESLLDVKCNFYNDSDYDKYVPADENFWIIGIGDNASRKRVSEKLHKECIEFVVVDLGVYVADDVKIGLGTVIGPGAVIQNNVVLGKGVIINTSASVDHDCQIGDYCHIAPNVTLCGDVKIGDCTLIGAGSVVLPGIEIGENCIIGAGSVVTKNIPSNSKAYGNPAKIK